MFRSIFKLFIIGTFVWLILGGITAYFLMQERRVMRGDDLVFRGKVTLLQASPALVVVVLLLIARGAANKRAAILAQGEIAARQQSDRPPARFDRSQRQGPGRVYQGQRPQAPRDDYRDRGFNRDRDGFEQEPTRNEALDRRRHRFGHPVQDGDIGNGTGNAAVAD